MRNSSSLTPARAGASCGGCWEKSMTMKTTHRLQALAAALLLTFGASAAASDERGTAEEA